MKNRIALLFKGLASLVLPVLLLTGCFEQSIVVKVNKDGSGIVHERSYANNAMGNMVTGGLGIEGSSAPAGGAPEVTVEESGSDVPTEAELKEVAARMGEGVTFKSVTEGKNKAGWTGYEVIYEFADINKLKIDMNNLGNSSQGAMGEEDTGDANEAPEEEEFATFEMADGVLRIHTPDPTDSLSKAGGGGPAEGDGGEGGAPGGAGNPFANADPSDPQAALGMQMMAGMMTGSRLGLFVEAGDSIAKTNARHQNGNFITLMMVEMGKVFQNPANMAKLEGMEAAGADRAEMQKVIDGIDGMTADLQETIVVEFE